MGPSCGTSCTRSSARAWSSVSSDGERPPWRQKICAGADGAAAAAAVPWSRRCVRRRSSIPAHLASDEGGHGQVVEEVCEEVPHVRVAVLAEALVVEAVHLRDLPRLMVAAEDRDALPVPDFQRHEERHSLEAVVPSIDVVSHKEVVRVGELATWRARGGPAFQKDQKCYTQGSPSPHLSGRAPQGRKTARGCRHRS